MSNYDPPKLTKEQAIQQLWDRGNLSFKLKGKQHDVKNALMEGIKEKDIHTVLCSRRFGKSFLILCWAIEICLKKKRAVIKYACPEQKQVQEILDKIMPVILEDCPDYLKPEWKEAKKRYVFPNGSEIQIAAVDNNRADNLRGGHADLCVVDEAGFCSKLSYVIYSVLAPTTDTTGGKIVLVSTPNYEYPNHEFHTDFIQPLREQDELIKFTIYDSPMVDEKRITQIIDRFPSGVDDPRFKCEYMCEIAVDTNTMVIPEFDENIQKDIIKEWERPPYYDIYVSGDPAAKDLTFILFGYYDYMQQKIVVEDELVLGGDQRPVTTEDIAMGIFRKEKLNFTDPLTKQPLTPFMRVMDSSHPILINDLWNDYKLLFTPTAKDNKDMQVDKLRRMIKSGNIVINPKCKNLLYHIRTTKWKTDGNGVRKGFQRVKGNKNYKGHHGDGVDALLYMVRNVLMNKNPYPDNYFELKGEAVFRGHRHHLDKKNKLSELGKRILGIKNYTD